MKTRPIVFCWLLVVAPIALGADETWVGSWGAAPLPPSPAVGPFPATPSFNKQTIRQIVRLSASGDQVRLRFTNEYGTRPLAIGAARIGIAAPDGSVRAGTERNVTFAGATAATIAAGAPLVSDPIALPVAALDSLSISIYLPEETGPCTCHATGMQEGYVSAEGNFTARAFTPVQTIQARAFISGVEVRATGPASAIVVIGDSISDGMGSTVGANRRWPDLLAERLAARDGRHGWGVVNVGISGNRVLGDGAGQSALARFDRDVLAVSGVSHVIVFEGINDIGMSFGRFEGPLAAMRELMPPGGQVTAESMIVGLRQMIARAHAKGLKIYGATIAPYEGAAYYSTEGEAVRRSVNSWIRSSGEFDAVLDFDAVLRDPRQPSRMADELHSGDFLHGSDAGYRAIADSIDLALFE